MINWELNTLKKTACILCSLLLLTGCKKVPVSDVGNTDNTNQTATETTVAAYSAIDKMGVLHADSFIFTDEGMTTGFPVKAGEAVKLIGESNNNYIVFYGDKKGYISKNFVLIVDGTDSNTSENDSKVISVSENVVVNEKVETKIVTQVPIEEYLNSISKSEAQTTTAAPPTTIYTTKKSNNSGYSSELSSHINTARKANDLNGLSADSALNKEAAYYCDIFVKQNSISSISGYKVQASGKVKSSGDLNKAGKSIAKNIVGFNDDSISKIGVSVIEGDRGYLYYVVLGK